MAIVEGNFVVKLHEIATVPQDEIKNYRIYGNLMISKKTVYNSYLHFQFSQIAELFQALDEIEKEIIKNDYAILRNESVVNDLFKVFTNFKTILAYDAYTLNRINVVRNRCIAYVPLEIENGLPAVRGVREVKTYFDVLVDDLVHERFSKESPQNLRFFIRVMAYGARCDFWPETYLKSLQKHVNEIVFQLLEKPLLTAEEIDFLVLVLGNRQFSFSQYTVRNFLEFLEQRLVKCTKINADRRSIIRLESLCSIVKVYKHLERFFMGHSLDINQLCQSNFIPTLTKYLIEFIEELPKLNKDPSAREKIKEAFLLVPIQNGTDSIFYTMVNKLYLSGALRLKHSSICNAGFIVTKDNIPCVSEDWLSVLETLHYDVQRLLNVLYRNYSTHPPRTPEYEHCQHLASCIDIAYDFQYYVLEALKGNGSDIFIEKLTELNREQLNKVSSLIQKGNYSLQRVTILLNAAEKASNKDLVEICYTYLSLHIFKKQELKWTVNLSEEQFKKIVARVNVKILSKCQFDVTKFPNITLASLKELLKKIPDIDLVNFPCLARSNLCDIVISNGSARFFHFNKDVLARSSKYFRAMFESSLREATEVNRGTMKQKLLIELDDESFQIFYKWVEVILQPNLEVARSTIEEEDPSRYVLEVNFAKYFGMDHILAKMKLFYTAIAKEKSLDYFHTPPTPQGLTLRWFPTTPKAQPKENELHV